MAHATPRLIDRDDLLAALDRAAARKVTIISAPAGSGKTSLLRAWAGRQGQRRRLALLQVQRNQQDAQQFWLALLDAVRHASATTGRAGPSAATPDFYAPAMVDRVLSELDDARGDITVVIDDLHELNSPEALAQLTRLLMNLPPPVHAILTTRHDLRLGLHQLRLAGELAEIRAAEASLSNAQALFEKTIVRSPLDAVVLRRYRKTGESVIAKDETPIVSLGATSRLRVRVDVDETDVNRLREGQKAWVRADAYGDRRFTGRVVRIGQILGPKNISTDRAAEKLDAKILETLVELDPGQTIPVGLRVDAYIQVDSR